MFSCKRFHCSASLNALQTLDTSSVLAAAARRARPWPPLNLLSGYEVTSARPGLNLRPAETGSAAEHRCTVPFFFLGGPFRLASKEANTGGLFLLPLSLEQTTFYSSKFTSEGGNFRRDNKQNSLPW